MRYTTLLFDLDHTLLDSDESERQAYAHTMATIGLDDSGAHFDRYVTINREMWRCVEAGDIQPAHVRHRRFERFIAELDLDADANEMADAFVWGLAHYGDLYPGAREVLGTLSKTATLAVVTNGLTYVQRTRIDRLDLGAFFHTVTISEEVGATKPRQEIFDITFERLGEPDRSSALMIGDSLTSDIAGGRNYGIDTCWYNPHGTQRPDGTQIDHEIASLGELTDITAVARRSGESRG